MSGLNEVRTKFVRFYAGRRPLKLSSSAANPQILLHVTEAAFIAQVSISISKGMQLRLCELGSPQ